MVVKVWGLIFSVASGLPVGKEGPIIHVGAGIAAGVTQGKSTTLGFNTRWSVFQDFRTDREKRDHVVCGAAAGVSAAFGAPVGGVLFAIEEGATHWYRLLVWRTFLCAIATAWTLQLFLSGIDGAWGVMGISGLLSFGSFAKASSASWQAWELPLFIGIGALGGVGGAIMVAAQKRITRWRARFIPSEKPLVRVAEVAGIVLIFMLIQFLLSYYVGGCQPLPAPPPAPSNSSLGAASEPQPSRAPSGWWRGGVPLLSAGDPSPAAHQQFYCHNGSFNELSSFFMVPAEEAIRTLFHYENPYTIPNLTIFSCVYFVAMVLAYGISVPAGLFIPALLSGAGMGRIIGELLVKHLPEAADVNAGTYALVGAAGMLGGVTRMTISLAVILMETTGNVVFALPLISTLMTSRFVGNFFNEGIYDTHIELKGWPLLPDHVPKKLLRELRACDVMSKPPLVLRELETVGGALAALQRTTHNAFPVVYSEGMMRAHPRLGSLCGLITRRELSVLLTKKAFHADLPSLPFDVVQPNPTRSSLSAFAINLSGVHMRPQEGTGGGLSTVGGENGRRFDAAAALLSVDDAEVASTGGSASGLRSGAAMQSFGSREGVATASPYLGAVSSVAQPTRSLNSGMGEVAAAGEGGDSGLSGASDPGDKREDSPLGSRADAAGAASKGRKAGSGMLSRWFGGGDRDSRSSVGARADPAASATGLSSSPSKTSASRSIGLLSSSPAASSVRLRMPSVVDASFGGFNAGSSSALDRGTTSLLEGYGHTSHRDLPDGASASLLHLQQPHYGSGDVSPALIPSLSSSLRSPSRSGMASIAMLGEQAAPSARNEGDFSPGGLEDAESRNGRAQTLSRRLRRPSNIRISGPAGEPSETIVVPAAPPLLPSHGSTREAPASAVDTHEAALSGRAAISRTALATLQASSPRGSSRFVDSTGFGASAGISRESSGLGRLSFRPHSDSVADLVGHAGGHSAASVNPSPEHEHPVLAVSATPTAARFLPDAGVQASEAYRIHVALEDGAADGSGGVLHFEAQPDILELVYSTEPLLRSEDFDAYYPRYPDVADMSLSSEEASSYLDLRPYLNPTPFTVHLHAPVERAIELFHSLGLRHLVVVNDSHDVVGIITRKDLLLHNLSQRKDEKRGRTERTRDVDVDTA